MGSEYKFLLLKHHFKTSTFSKLCIVLLNQSRVSRKAHFTLHDGTAAYICLITAMQGQRINQISLIKETPVATFIPDHQNINNISPQFRESLVNFQIFEGVLEKKGGVNYTMFYNKKILQYFHIPPIPLTLTTPDFHK